MKFNGSQKQNKWAEEILNNSNLTDEQIDNLLRYAGPTLHDAGIMDVTIIIENRNSLAAYADALGSFYQLTPAGKHAVAEGAANMVRNIAASNMRGNRDGE